MVAQINSDTFAPASYTPAPIPSDPDDVRLALETAQAFVAMGEICEAVEWLERAAERAAQAGQHERAVAFLQAMAGLTNRNAPTPWLASTPSSAPSSDVRDRGFVRPPPTKLPPCPARLRSGLSSLPPPARKSSLLPPPPLKSLPPPARKSSLPPAPMLSPVSSSPKGPLRASAPPKRSSPASARAAATAQLAIAPVSTPANEPLTERTVRVNTIRVAIASSVPEAGRFTIERLAKGQPLPAGTKEATLVLSDEVDR
jgi:hypothetical protein